VQRCNTGYSTIPRLEREPLRTIFTLGFLSVPKNQVSGMCKVPSFLLEEIGYLDLT
jgi:hypothetical protein